MKKDFLKLKELLDNDYLLNNYLCIKEKDKNIYVFFKDYNIVVTCVGIGFGYLYGGWINGCITLSQSKAINTLMTNFNNYKVGIK